MSLFFKRGENFYAVKRYLKAEDMYLLFISESLPEHPLVDNAYFMAGMGKFKLGRYRDAQLYFDKVLTQHSNSDLLIESLINLGICQYNLNDFESASKTLKRARQKVSTPFLLSYILYYQANLAERTANYTKAVDYYIQSEKLASDTDLVINSQEKLKRILRNFLTEVELLEIAEGNAKEWPAKEALVELQRLYKSQNNKIKLASIDEKIKSQFSNDSFSIEKLLPFGNFEHRPLNIKIGAVLPLSGPSSKFGREVLQGIQLAFSSFHKLTKEQQVRLVIKDSKGNFETAVAAIKDLASDRDVLLILGPVFSDEFKASARVAGYYRIPIFSPSAKKEGVAALSEYLFRNVITNQLEAKIMARYAILELGIYKLSIVYPADEAGRQLNNYFTKEIESFGGKVVVAEPYDPSQTDFGVQIRRLGGFTDTNLRRIVLQLAKEIPDATVEELNTVLAERYSENISVPQIIEHANELPLNGKNFRPGLQLSYGAIFMPGLYEKISLILPELDFYNLKGLIKLGGSAANHTDLVKIAERYAEGLTFVDGFFSKSKYPYSKNFAHKYRLNFHREPSKLAAQAYDAARITLSSIVHGARTRKEVGEYIRSLQSFNGVSGLTTMNESGDSDKSGFMLTVKQGKIVELLIERKQAGSGHNNQLGDGDEIF